MSTRPALNQQIRYLHDHIIYVISVANRWNYGNLAVKKAAENSSIQPASTCTNPDMYLAQQKRKGKLILGDGNCFLGWFHKSCMAVKMDMQSCVKVSLHLSKPTGTGRSMSSKGALKTTSQQ